MRLKTTLAGEASASVENIPMQTPKPRLRKTWKFFAIPLLLLTLVLAPFGLSPSALSILSLSLVYGLFTYGLDLSWGRVGLISVGHAAFFGVGAYAVAIGSKAGMNIFISAILGVLVATVLALALGTVALSAPEALGVPLLILLSLGISQLLERLATSIPAITGGANGLTMPSMGLVSGYYIVLATCIVGVVVTFVLLVSSRRGFFQDASLINPLRAEHLGINLKGTRLVAFAVSGTIAAVAGALFAPLVGIVTPTAVGLALSTSVLTWLAVGGKGSVFGPFIGAGILTIGTQTLSGTWQSWYIFATAALFIAVVLFAPAGSVGLIRRLSGRAATQKIIPKRVRPLQNKSMRSEPTDAPLLEVNELKVDLGGVTIVKGVSLGVSPGEVVCLIGPNGAGKSTLLGAIAGSVEASSGSVILKDQDVTKLPIYRRVRMGMGRMFQVAEIFDDYSVTDNLRAAQIMSGQNNDIEVGDRQRKASELSMAERRHLELDMIMTGPPDLVLLDEPAAGLSRSETASLASRIQSVAAKQKCGVLVVEHDMELVRQLADRVIVLSDGHIIAEGSMDDVVAHEEVQTAYIGVE